MFRSYQKELITSKAKNISFWINENGMAELDFIFERNGQFIPIEVKAGENLQAKSLRVFREKHPEIHCLRTSLSDFRKEDWMTNVPLYAMGIL